MSRNVICSHFVSLVIWDSVFHSRYNCCLSLGFRVLLRKVARRGRLHHAPTHRLVQPGRETTGKGLTPVGFVSFHWVKSAWIERNSQSKFFADCKKSRNSCVWMTRAFHQWQRREKCPQLLVIGQTVLEKSRRHGQWHYSIQRAWTLVLLWQSGCRKCVYYVMNPVYSVHYASTLSTSSRLRHQQNPVRATTIPFIGTT